MSTASKIGNVFGSAGSGVASFGGPVGMGIGTAFSALGGIIGMGAQIRQRKREEEERKRQLEEAQRKQLGDEARAAGEQSSQQTQRATPTQAPMGKEPQQQGTGVPGQPQAQDGEPQQPQRAAVMGQELANVFAGLKPGGGGFYAG